MDNSNTIVNTYFFISIYSTVPSQPFILNSIKLLFSVKQHFVIAINHSDVRAQQRRHLATSRHCSVDIYPVVTRGGHKGERAALVQ